MSDFSKPKCSSLVTKSLDLEILKLFSNNTFNPFTDKFKLESRLTESGSDETFQDNTLTAFDLSPQVLVEKIFGSSGDSMIL